MEHRENPNLNFYAQRITRDNSVFFASGRKKKTGGIGMHPRNASGFSSHSHAQERNPCYTQGRVMEPPICLGTAQFGLHYGIANTTGKPSYEQAREIIKKACNNGIIFFDTAAAYGSSEEVIGKAVEELNLKDTVKIITKIPKMGNSYSSTEAGNFIRKNIENSFKRLCAEEFEAVLFHYEGDYIYWDILRRISEDYPIKKTGFSIDSTNCINEILKTDFRIIQFPYNILDSRFDNLMEQCKTRKISVFTRSMFLQGLLLMPEEQIKPELKTVIPVLRKLKNTADKLNMSMIEFLTSYILSNPVVTKIVMGVDNITQLMQNIQLISNCSPLDSTVLKEIKEIVPVFPENIIRPAFWKT